MPRTRVLDSETAEGLSKWSNRIPTLIRRKGSMNGKLHRPEPVRKISPNMIRRLDEKPMPVNPSGHAMSLKQLDVQSSPAGSGSPDPRIHVSPINSPLYFSNTQRYDSNGRTKHRRFSDPQRIGRKASLRTSSIDCPRAASLDFPWLSSRRESFSCDSS